MNYTHGLHGLHSAACLSSGNVQVALRRGRQCLPVKATRVGDLPKGSMKLGTSASGAHTLHAFFGKADDC